MRRFGVFRFVIAVDDESAFTPYAATHSLTEAIRAYWARRQFTCIPIRQDGEHQDIMRASSKGIGLSSAAAEKVV
jgi:hypothetical protein